MVTIMRTTEFKQSKMTEHTVFDSKQIKYIKDISIQFSLTYDIHMIYF